jgi:hypothetical protein
MHKARPKEPAVLDVGVAVGRPATTMAGGPATTRPGPTATGATRAVVVVTRRPLSRVILPAPTQGSSSLTAASPADPALCRSSPTWGTLSALLKPRGVKQRGWRLGCVEESRRWGLHSRARARPAVSRMPHWRTRHVACDAQHAQAERFLCHPSPNSLPRFKRANTWRPQVPD